MQPDRHARLPRTVPDPRRRPDAGFRLRSSERFAAIAVEVLTTMPEPVASALRGVTIRHAEVPPPPGDPDAPVPLVRIEAAGRRARVLEIYRRPLEARAISALDLSELLRVAIAREAADVIGLELGEEWDDLD